MREWPESVRVSDAGLVRAVDTLRGRRPEASDEGTRGKRRGAGGLWGFGRTAALAEDGFAQIAETKAAEDGGLGGAVVLGGVIEEWSVMLCRRLQAL